MTATTRAPRKHKPRQRLRGKNVAANKKALSNVLTPDEQNSVRDGVFIPSDRQQRFLECFLSFEAKRFSISAVCKNAGITRQIYYVWRRNPAFLKWYNDSRTTLSDAEMMHIDRVLHDQAKGGNLAAIRTVYEKRGELFKRMELDLNQNVKAEKDLAALQRLIAMVSQMELPPGVVWPAMPGSPAK